MRARGSFRARFRCRARVRGKGKHSLSFGCSLSAPAGPTQLTISRAAGLVGGPRVYMCAKSSCAASVKRGG